MNWWTSLWNLIHLEGAKRLGTPEGGVGFSREISWTGYDVEAEQMANAKRLQNLCDEAVNNHALDAEPDGDGGLKTKCNLGVRFICEGMGCKAFGPRDTANAMLSLMGRGNGWSPLPLERVAEVALRGALVVIGAYDEPNGHVAVAYPLPAQDSGTWGMKVPVVANIGMPPNKVKRVSQSFLLAQKALLKAFLWEDSLA